MTMKRNLVSEIASLIDAVSNCEQSGNDEWKGRHSDRLSVIESNCLPYGSGVDSGCTIDIGRSKPNRLVITTSFHHMNQDGYYDGWSSHDVIVTPSLQWGFDLRITGKDRNDIKNYLYDLFQNCLEGNYTEYVDGIMRDKYSMGRAVGTL